MRQLFLFTCYAGMFAMLHSQLALAQNALEQDSELKSIVEQYVQAKEIAGAIVMVSGKQGPLALASAGFADLSSQRPIDDQSLFWIASMSKPVTGACVMLLEEQGKLSLADPITKYLPEMANLELDGQSVSITLGQLLSHTSGMAELKSGEAYTSLSLSEAAQRYSKVRVLFPPGSKWQYSQTSINTAARIVEVVSGVSFDQFVQQRICAPLKMTDTTFYLSADQHQRLAKSYRRTDQGELEATEIMLLAGKSPTARDRMPAANGGLFSTIGDYERFCRMLLRDGELDGVRLLSAETVKRMRTVVTGDLVTGFTPGNGWGVGCCVIRQPQGVTSMLSTGSFGHGGAYGTQAWIDPEKERIYLLMTQRANFPNSDASELRRAFQEAASKK